MEEMSIYDITESNRINALLNKRWLRHLLYWGITVMFFTFFWGSDKNDYQTVLLNELMLLPPKLLAVYTVLMLLVPRLLFKKKVAAIYSCYLCGDDAVRNAAAYSARFCALPGAVYIYS